MAIGGERVNQGIILRFHFKKKIILFSLPDCLINKDETLEQCFLKVSCKNSIESELKQQKVI